jgi:hypothetical protein
VRNHVAEYEYGHGYGEGNMGYGIWNVGLHCPDELARLVQYSLRWPWTWYIFTEYLQCICMYICTPITIRYCIDQSISMNLQGCGHLQMGRGVPAGCPPTPFTSSHLVPTLKVITPFTFSVTGLDRLPSTSLQATLHPHTVYPLPTPGTPYMYPTLPYIGSIA